MLDYKNTIIKRYALGLNFKQLAEEFHASKSRVNDFIRAFESCEKLSYPLPEGITNYAISAGFFIPMRRLLQLGANINVLPYASELCMYRKM